MTTPTTDIPLRLYCTDAVPAREMEYARSKVLAALRHASEPVLYARAALTLLVDPAVVCPAVAQVNVDLNGRTIRSSVARPTLREAIDALHDRLQERLQRLARDWEALRGGRPGDEQWRHGARTAERPEYFPRALDERGLVRHKTFTPSVATVDEAAFDMEMLDYEFHLFTEMGSGQVSVLTRLAGGGFQLAQAEPHPELVSPGVTPVVVSGERPPVLTDLAAVDRLEQTGWPFVFFRDATSGQGRLLYHRYDGDYGLITPAE